MSGIELEPLPLTAERFAPFGDVIAAGRAVELAMNEARFERFDDLARVDVAGGRLNVSVARCRTPTALPYRFDMVERHPLGSQAFYPLSQHPFLVVVAPDESGTPGTPRAFLTGPGQGVNIAMNTWHGVLTPLAADADFLCVDRGGEGNNLEEHFFAEPWTVQAT